KREAQRVRWHLTIRLSNHVVTRKAFGAARREAPTLAPAPLPVRARRRRRGAPRPRLRRHARGRARAPRRRRRGLGHRRRRRRGAIEPVKALRLNADLGAVALALVGDTYIVRILAAAGVSHDIVQHAAAVAATVKRRVRRPACRKGWAQVLTSAKRTASRTCASGATRPSSPRCCR